jgi:hypothetical protein
MVLIALLGGLDAVGEITRQVAVQAETPDAMRGRVTALYQVASNGGPSVGQTFIGGLATAFGIPFALLIGGGVTVVYTGLLAIRSSTVRNYAHLPAVVASKP